ncbi:MAG: hypothetical protein KAV00_16730 [Phycisphaerae bacterium]|nr:hypothetical protein [Phycisphaerae bacterium]
MMGNAMKRTPMKSENARRGLLAVLMLVVLSGSVGIAWMLERRSDKKTEAGAQIIRQIREKGLGNYWPDKLQIDWFLVQAYGETIGWKASARGEIANGKFVGVNMEVLPNRRHSHEIWTLNPDATIGTYHADFRAADGSDFKTDIFLKDGVVKVRQHAGGAGTPVAHSQAPENYLPEGTLQLAVQRVAESRANAQFAMVFNEQAIIDDIVEFGTLRMEYTGKKKNQQGQDVNRVELSEVRMGKKHKIVYDLDKKGKILVVYGEKMQWTSAGKQDVQKAFPNAPQLLQQMLLIASHAGTTGAGS